jgi:heme A synthase
MQSRHLGLALATARVVAWIGMLLIAAGIAYGITATVSHQAAGVAALALGMVINLVGTGLMALLVSGALAALVGIKESQRRRNERD